MNQKAMTVVFLLNHHWTVEEMRSGKPERIINAAMKDLTVGDWKEIKRYEQTGSLINA